MNVDPKETKDSQASLVSLAKHPQKKEAEVKMVFGDDLEKKVSRVSQVSKESWVKKDWLVSKVSKATKDAKEKLVNKDLQVGIVVIELFRELLFIFHSRL